MCIQEDLVASVVRGTFQYAQVSGREERKRNKQVLILKKKTKTKYWWV